MSRQVAQQGTDAFTELLAEEGESRIELAASEEALEWAESKVLLRQAARYRVSLPYGSKKYWAKQGRIGLLTPVGSQELKRLIWQRRIEIFGIVIGVLTAVQTVFAVLDYFKK